MISIYWPALVLVCLDKTILGWCFLKEFTVECWLIPLIKPQWAPSTSWSIPSQHLHWYLVKSWLTVGGQSTYFHRHVFKCRLIIQSANFWPTEDRVSIKMSTECQLRINQGYWLTADHRYLCTHDLNSEDLLSLLTFLSFTCTLPVKESKQCRYFW